MTARRRTPTEMAADALAKAEAKVERLSDRLRACRETTDRLVIEYGEARKMRDHAAAHPLLQDDESEES